MSSSKLPSLSLSYLIAFTFLLHPALSDSPLFHFCTSSEQFADNSPYAANLIRILNNLNDQTPRTGFSKSSSGQQPNRPNGLALCRGDVSVADCRTCIGYATREIRNRCANNKGAVIWFDNCLLKYSNDDFFGKIDWNRFYMWNVNKVSGAEGFNENSADLLSELVDEAVEDGRLFAEGEMEIGENMKLYGLTQCTRDLSGGECKRCLDGIISEIPRCCDGKQGGRVVGGSCNFRYEIYPFLNH